MDLLIRQLLNKEKTTTLCLEGLQAGQLLELLQKQCYVNDYLANNLDALNAQFPAHLTAHQRNESRTQFFEAKKIVQDLYNDCYQSALNNCTNEQAVA